MGLFGRKEEPQQPVPDPKIDALEQKVGQLADTVNNFVQAQKPAAPPPEDDDDAPIQMQQETLPPIEDISEEDYEEAMEEGGARARKASEIRRRAEAERQRREFDSKLTQVSAQGTKAINETTIRLALQDAKHYHANPKVKQEVDKHLKQLTRQGVLLDQKSIQWLYSKAVGDHTDELVESAREEALRQLREPEEITQRRGARAQSKAGMEQDNNEYPQPEDLDPRAEELLSSRNRGRGQSPDEFARSLPPHRYYDHSQKRFITRRYDSWNDYMAKDAEAKEEVERQREAYFGR